ncbi:hypothetical protein BG003_006155 [Podila horticola]|nr:hypothetical protein BG003_006155 [Podila horticola]
MDPHNLKNGAPVALASAPTTHSTTTTTSAPADFQVGGVGVPGAQVELLNSNIRPQSHQHLAQQQQNPVEHTQHQQQQNQQQHLRQGHFFSQPAATTSIPPHQEAVPQQFQQSHQQSFFTQPDISESINERQEFQGVPSIIPANTNRSGTGDPGLHVGGVGVLGAHVEFLPAKLDSVENASASRPPVEPFDLPAQRSTLNAGDASVPPMIQIQREDSMRGHPTPLPAGQYKPGQTVTYDAQNPHHDGGSVNMTSSTTGITVDPTAPAKVHIASAEVVAAADATNAADAETRGRRSSLAILADKLRPSSRSRSRGEERSTSLSRRLSRSLSRTEDDEEPSGPYANVKLAQQEYINKLRAEQEKNNITTNADGIPIPQPQERRRSSVAHVLGLDKPLLSR